MHSPPPQDEEQRVTCIVQTMTASVDIGDVTLTYRGASGGVLALQGHDASMSAAASSPPWSARRAAASRR